MKKILSLVLCLLAAWSAPAQEVNTQPQVHGTLRGKYEYQTSEGEGRFEVRTARVSVSGKLMPEVEYKAEIDLCDEGVIKMLDAYTRLKPWRYFQSAASSQSRWAMCVT